MTTGTVGNSHVVDHILIEPLPYPDPTVEVHATNAVSTSGTLQRVQAESLLPGVPRRALQVAQSSESEALFQLGALQTTAATPAASKAAARTRSHRRDLRTPGGSLCVARWRPKGVERCFAAAMPVLARGCDFRDDFRFA